MKDVLILGSTGSIGKHTLDVVSRLSNEFNVVGITTNQNVELVMEQVEQFSVKFVGIVSAELTVEQSRFFNDHSCEVFIGENCLQDIVAATQFDILVNSVVGAAGFIPTNNALEKCNHVALANKETLVIGGELVMQKAAERNVKIYPIDSEHSAIFQCLMGEDRENVEEIILTASGGPFRTWSYEQLQNVTVEQALAHPNWVMGQKITIDSATLMNKALEVIEARWLFDVHPDQIRVVVHPQSIIHSMVVFNDGSIKAQLGEPDMRVPIQLALTYPKRLSSTFPRVDFTKLKQLDFETPNETNFPALSLAFSVLKSGGTAPAVLNAANEIAVYAFLDRNIEYSSIVKLVKESLARHSFIEKPNVDDLLAADKWARDFVKEKIRG